MMVEPKDKPPSEQPPVTRLTCPHKHCNRIWLSSRFNHVVCRLDHGGSGCYATKRED